jgi:hypothetical protein
MPLSRTVGTHVDHSHVAATPVHAGDGSGGTHGRRGAQAALQAVVPGREGDIGMGYHELAVIDPACSWRGWRKRRPDEEGGRAPRIEAEETGGFGWIIAIVTWS